MAWHDKGITPTKDKRMEMTEENFNRVIEMRDELIFEQKMEISKLKSKVNELQLKLKSNKWTGS
jgi:uncharacterized coiled-coil protein SlyX